MKNLYILVGAPGSGKSTYAEAVEGTVISSDRIRDEILGGRSGQSGAAHSKVFNIAHNRIKEAFDLGEENVYFDATNISRKHRTHLYNTFKDAKVTTVLFLLPLRTLLRNNRKRKYRVPDGVIIRMHKWLEVPKINLDTDAIELAYNISLTEFEGEFSQDTPHDSSYHQETVYEHINRCAELSPGARLREISLFHDLGKFICKEKTGEYARFTGHDRVSAMYYLVYIRNKLDREHLENLEVIFHHLVYHGGLSDKYIRKHKLTTTELELLREFSIIDDKARIVKEGTN